MKNPFHIMSIRIYYEDTDAGGVVYYANYLRFAERARTEMMRTLLADAGLRQMQQDGQVFVVRRCEVDYRAPALLDDLLTVESRITKCGRASVTFQQTIRRDDTVIADCLIALTCVSLPGGDVTGPLRPTPIPPHVREVMMQHIC